MQKRELNTCKQDIYSFLHFLLPTNPRLLRARYFFSLSLQPFLSGCGLRFCRLAFALIPGCDSHFALRFPVCGPRLPAAVSLSAGRCCGIDGQERNALRVGKHGAFGWGLHDLLIVGREIQFGPFADRERGDRYDFAFFRGDSVMFRYDAREDRLPLAEGFGDLQFYLPAGGVDRQSGPESGASRSSCAGTFRPAPASTSVENHTTGAVM